MFAPRRLATVASLVCLAAACTSRRGTSAPEVDVESWLPSATYAETLPPVPGSDERRNTPQASLPLGEIPPHVVRIGLRDALRTAVEHGLEIEVAREHAVAAVAEADIARSEWWPELSLGTRFVRHEGELQNTEGRFFGVDKQNTFFGTDVGLTVDFSQAIFGARGARERAEAASHAVRTSTNDSLLDVAFAYFDLLESYARIRIASEASRHASEQLAFEQERVENGSGLEADAARARAYQASVERALIRSRGEARVASARLAELLRSDPSVELAPAGAHMIAFELVDWRSTDELIERALVARPELADAKARVRARRADERAAENAWLLPELELGATLGEYGLNYGNHEDRQVYSAALRWDLGAGLIGERDRDRALRRAAEFQQARMEDAVVSQVVQSAALVEARFDELAAASSEVTAAEVAFQLVRARHEAGASLLLEVLEVEVGLVRARAGHVDALAGYNRAQYALLHAVGEGSPQGQ